MHGQHRLLYADLTPNFVFLRALLRAICDATRGIFARILPMLTDDFDTASSVTPRSMTEQYLASRIVQKRDGSAARDLLRVFEPVRTGRPAERAPTTM